MRIQSYAEMNTYQEERSILSFYYIVISKQWNYNIRGYYDRGKIVVNLY